MQPHQSEFSENIALRALVIDDDPIFRRVAVKILQSAGWSVDEADGVKGALNLARSHAYQWILIDYRLPNEGDGTYLARTIRAWAGPSAGAHLTGTSILGMSKHCLEAGMNDFLMKPVDTVRLRELSGQIAARFRDAEVSNTQVRNMEEHRDRLIRAIDRLRDQDRAREEDLDCCNQSAS